MDPLFFCGLFDAETVDLHKTPFPLVIIKKIGVRRRRERARGLNAPCLGTPFSLCLSYNPVKVIDPDGVVLYLLY